MRNTMKKAAAFLLTLVLTVTMVPAGVMADDPAGTSNPVQFGNGNPARGTGIALNEIANIQVVSVTSDGSAAGSGTVERHEKISIQFSYNIQDDKLAEAKNKLPWTYDISGYVGEDRIFSELIGNEAGTMYDGETPAGTYRVTSDGQAELMPTQAWLDAHTNGVAGTFTVKAQLNETISQDKETYDFSFPGGASTTITFRRKTLKADKYAYQYQGAAELAHAYAYDTEDGTKPTDSSNGGKVELIDAGDGTYRLYYEIRVQANCKPNATLMLTDALGGGQELIPNTLEVYIPHSERPEEIVVSGSDSNPYLSVNADKSFSLNLKAALEAKYGADTSGYVGKNIWIRYYTVITDENLKNIQTNTATVTYDSKTVTPSTTITPSNEKSLSAYKWISSDPEVNTHTEGINKEMTVGTDGKVYFLTGGKLSAPATSLTVTDASAGVVIDPNTIRVAIGKENEPYQGYEWYRDLTASGAYTAIADGSFTFNVHKFIRYLVEDKKTNSEGKTYSELYKDYYYINASTGTFTLKTGTTFKMCYSGTAQEGYLPGAGESQQNVNNTATWTSSYLSEPASVDVKLLPDPGTPKLTKNGFGLDNGEAVNKPDGSAARNIPAGRQVRYELTAAKKTADGVKLNMAGHTVIDRIQNYISEVPETIEIFNSKGTRIAVYNTAERTWTEGAGLGLTIQVVNDGSEGGWSAPVGIAEGVEAGDAASAWASVGMSYDLFKLTFPEGDGVDFTDEYTIKYIVELDKDMPAGDGLYGVIALENKGGIGIGTPNPDVTVKTNIDYGFPYGSKKRFLEWDKENNEAVWAVDIDLGDLDEIVLPLQIIEYYYSGHAWVSAGNNHGINANQYSFEAYELQAGGVQGSKLTQAENEAGALMNQYIIRDYSDDPNYPRRELVFPKGINRNVRAIIRMKLPDNLKDQLEYHAHNAAYVKIGVNDMSVTADADYYDDDFDFSKEGEFSYKTPEGSESGKAYIVWTAHLNPTGKALKNDFKPVFRDTLPNGLKTEGHIHIAGYRGSSTTKSFDVKVPDSSGLTGSFSYNLIDVIREQWDNATDKNIETPPDGLSGWHFRIIYTTALTQDQLDEINRIRANGKLENISFTNHAGIYDTDETLLKQASDTIEYEYQDLVSKTDISETDSDENVSTLSYRIVINEKAQRINDGQPLRLQDAIPGNMSLSLDTVNVELAGATEEEKNHYTISYDTSRLLEISVPDETKAIVTFNAKPGSEGNTFINTALLIGSGFSQTSTTERTYQGNSAATITGMSYDVKIHKIDKYDLTKKMPDAQFAFYRCTVDNGRILSEERIFHTEDSREVDFYTTNTESMLTFAEITPNTLYSWKEIKAPEGYLITSNVPHYFAVYQVLNDSNRVTVSWNQLSEETRTAIKQYRGYDPAEGEGIGAAAPWIYVKASGPASGQEDEYAANHYCWLSGTEYPSGTGYTSLMDEVNAINRTEADMLASRVNEYYDGQKTAVSVNSGYTWQVENIKETVTTVNLQASKKLVGRAMEEEEFTFFLYDDTVDGHSRLLQTQSGPAGADGETKIITFDPVSIAAAGTYHYRICEKAGNADQVNYDPATYSIMVTADYEKTEDGTNFEKLIATITEIRKTKDGGEPADVTEDGLPVSFINTYGTGKLTGNKIWADGGKNHNNRSEIILTLHQKSVKEGSTETTYAMDALPTGSSFAWGTGENRNAYTYSNLPKYDAEGYEYSYWVVEDRVTDYDAPVYINTDTSVTDKALDGATIINGRSGKKNLTGSKSWVDGGKTHDNAREITLTLERTTKPVSDTSTWESVTATPSWSGDTYTYSDLDQYNVSGVEYEYRVSEAAIKGYTTTQSGNNFVNTQKTGNDEVHDSVEIDKTDGTNPLGGAVFALKSADTEIATYTTSSAEDETKGKVTISTSDTALANYLPEAGEEIKLTLSEKTPPAGYSGSESTWTVKISAAENTEYDPDRDMFITTKTYTMTIDGGDKIVVTNTKYGKITVVKTVQINGEKMNLPLMDGTYYFGLFDSDDKQVGATQSITIASGAATSPNVVFDKLLPGEYTVKELSDSTANAAVYSVKDVTVSYQDMQTVTVQGDEHTVEVINDKALGHLTLKKTVAAPEEMKVPQSYTFHVQGVTDKLFYGADGTTGTDAVAIAVTPGETGVELKNIPLQDYIVTEVTGTNNAEIAVDGYDVTVNGNEQTVTVKKNETAAATITNTYIRETGSLQILKKVAVNGKITDTNKVDGTYSFKVKGAATVNPATEGVVTIVVKNGKVESASSETLSVAAKNGAAVVSGLPTGEYTVTEDETVLPEGISLIRSENTTVNVVKDGTGEIPAAVFTNSINEVRVSKVDATTAEELEGATIQILDSQGKVVDEWVSGKETHVTEGLKTGETYTLKETVAPDGYLITSDTTFSIDETGKVTASGSTTTDKDGNTVLLVEDAKTHIEVSKVDSGNGEELEGATIQILDSQGNVVDEWVSSKDETHKVEGLKTGEEYTLRETVAPEGYAITTDTTFTIDETGKVTSTGSTTKDEKGNTVLLVEDDKTRIEISKVDVTSGEELEGATIQILDSKGNVVDEWVSSKDETHVVEGLLKVGEEYTLRETVAPDGYDITVDTTFVLREDGSIDKDKTTVKIREDGVLLVEDAPLMISVTILKVWKDDNNRDGARPVSLTVKLLANGKEYSTETLTAENHWTLTKTRLRKVDGSGNEIKYTWEEVVPAGYTPESATLSKDGRITTLTNVYGPAKTSVSVKKVWEDSNNYFRTRPGSIRVQLYADGTACGEPVALSEANGWSYTWTDLNRNVNRTGGTGAERAIVYTVEEISVPAGYKTIRTGDAAKGFVITNSIERGKLTIEKRFETEDQQIRKELEALTEVPVTKVWDDFDNRDGNRPESITVRLYAGGEEIRQAQLSEGNGWAYTFTGLPKYEDNKTIRYSISEDPVDMYVAQINGYTILNKYMPQTTVATVHKVWDDNGDEMNIRPSSVRMTLSNGTSVLLTAANGWSATVGDLPTIINGEAAEYTWMEQEVPGYVLEETKVNGNQTVFVNRMVKPARVPLHLPQPTTPGSAWYAVFEDYETALGGEMLINHVGDCFD